MEKVTDQLIDYVNEKILTYSGIYVAKSQHASLASHIEKVSSTRGISPEEFCRGLTPYTPDFDTIVNLVTVNETYFFREEKQFDFLHDHVFPKFMGKNLTIWTCCCSTGEEPISLLAMALSMNINLTIYASDIDDNALKVLSRGSYSLYSLRPDGKKYHELLKPYSNQTQTNIVFKKDFLHRIHSFKFNLIQGELSKLPFFENVDIIFMRNVFIYFDKETRTLVTKKVTERLKNEGLLFFSMNEIGSIDNSVIPSDLYKTNEGAVYYFVKNHGDAKKVLTTKPIDRRIEEKKIEKKNEKLKQEVEKVKLHNYINNRIEEKKLSDANSKSLSSSNKNAFNAKKVYESVCQEINRGDFVKARSLAGNINGSDHKKYSYFMKGYVEYHADNRADAETFFASAESISPDFWPAFFYHGIVLRDMGKKDEALFCFSKCKQLISDFGSEVPYDFALDSFSPAYITSLCETFSNVGGL
ncbi:MAG: hypothetical protein K6C97_09830 [Treponema sp.]|nr:hypothetical protein [Treponema sp.]